MSRLAASLLRRLEASKLYKMIEFKKILVTGGSGFIGSNFIRFIHNKYPDYKICNLDLLTYAGNPDNLRDLENSSRYSFVKGDICDPVILTSLFRRNKPGVVINFAAESHVDRSITNDFHFFRTNLGGVHNLISLVRKYQIPRFIQISTDEIYGDVDRGTSREHHPIRPSNPYAASKAAADIVVQSYMRTHQLPLLIVRGSNNFGPYQYPEKLIPLVTSNMLENKTIPVHGDGLQVRRWIHVDDFCNAIDLVMHKGKDFSIYNVAGIEISNMEIIKRIAGMLNKDPDKFIYHIADRPGGDRRYAPDATRIKQELGWKLERPVNRYLTGVVNWYLDNDAWWKKIKKKKEFTTYYKKQCRAEY